MNAQNTRYMRCFTSDGQKHVDIRIAHESETSRHYVLLAAHVLTADNMRTGEPMEYDYYALISKDGKGNMVVPAEGGYVGVDRRGNILFFDGDFNITERSFEPTIIESTGKMMMKDMGALFDMERKYHNPFVDTRE